MRWSAVSLCLQPASPWLVLLPAVQMERALWQQAIDAGAISQRGKRAAAEDKARQVSGSLCGAGVQVSNGTPVIAAAPLPLMGDAASCGRRTAQDVESGHISLQGVRMFALINLLYMFLHRPAAKCTVHGIAPFIRTCAVRVPSLQPHTCSMM